MKRPTRFTNNFVKSLKATGEQYDVREAKGHLGTLAIRVGANGLKSWYFSYRSQIEGKSTARRMTLGRYPDMSVSDANIAIGEARRKLERGEDPGEKAKNARKAQREAPTVADLAREYVRRYAKRNKRSWETDERVLGKEALPVLGHRKVRDITRRDILNLTEEIVERGSGVMANRTQSIIHKMFAWGVDNDYLETNPAQGIRRRVKETPRSIVLSQDELRSFWIGLEDIKMSPLLRIALRLILLTGQRRGEVISIEKADLDLGARTWIIPPQKAKNGRQHLVPLADLAFELVEQAVELSDGNNWLFPTSHGGKQNHFNPSTVSRVMRVNRAALGLEGKNAPTPHDLRRSAASQMSAGGIPRLVIDKVLNHTDGSVGAIYDRYDYAGEKRRALQTWERRLKLILDGVNPDEIGDDNSNVVTLPVSS